MLTSGPFGAAARVCGITFFGNHRRFLDVTACRYYRTFDCIRLADGLHRLCVEGDGGGQLQLRRGEGKGASTGHENDRHHAGEGGRDDGPQMVGAVDDDLAVAYQRVPSE